MRVKETVSTGNRLPGLPCRMSQGMRGTRIVLLFGVAAASLVLTAHSVPAATNLIANGTFEGTGLGSLSGWAASGGTLSLVTGNGGGHAAAGLGATAGSRRTPTRVEAGEEPSSPARRTRSRAPCDATGGTPCA